MKKLTYLIIALLVIAVAAIGIYSYKKNTAYTVEVSLTPEQRADYEAKVRYYSQRLEAVKASELPEIDDFTEKARYQEYLGRYGQAINTWLEAFKYYENTSVGWNNIARLYDKVGEYKLAAQFYIKLIDTFNLYRYYLDLSWDYYRLGEYDKAFETYGRYAQLTSDSEPQLLELILSKKK